MKKYLFSALLIIITITTASAQNNQKDRPHFSPEEFKAKQQAYITEKAELSPEEAEAFFPLFFELQKQKFDLERNARKNFKKNRNEKMTEEECRSFVYNTADAKIEVAKLEREYVDKYLNILSPCKLRKVQRAEWLFQRDLMKKMTGHKKAKKDER